MAHKRLRLTPQLHGKIVQGIQSGGYPHIAAEAMAVPRDVFDDWLARGTSAHAREPYRSFVRDVRAGFAQARLISEVAVYQDDPKAWLIHGPGRETPHAAGWSVSVKAAEASTESRNALLEPEMMQLFHLLMQVLVPFPDARGHVAQALMNFGVNDHLLGESHEKSSVCSPGAERTLPGTDSS
jgi:hypothetical protein